MLAATSRYQNRPARYVPAVSGVRVTSADMTGLLENISENGVLFTTTHGLPNTGHTFSDLQIETEQVSVPLPQATVVRTANGSENTVACSFRDPGTSALELLGPVVEPPLYIRGDLLRSSTEGVAKGLTHRQFARFAARRGRNILARCRDFFEYIDGLQQAGAYQTLYRVTTTTSLDNRTSVYNPFSGKEEEFICFDSNSYLGLHVHPRVLEATRSALDSFGYGSPSSQILSGTNRHLRELEETISAFHKREETIVFSSGYSANVGTISALVGKSDVVLADQFSHASLHDGARWAVGGRHKVFPHNDAATLGAMISEAQQETRGGTLVVSDGVFSMHGGLVDLPAIRLEARRNKATLMTGRGIEERFGCEGSIDILMGTLSKAPGTTGGYVCGTRELITYLRFFARSAMFSTALPAALCAGATEAFKLMMEDLEPLERLRANCEAFVSGLNQIGYQVAPAESAIVTILIGDPNLVVEFSRKLYERGIRCGAVAFPAVPSGGELLRLAMNARHTKDDIEQGIEALDAVGRELGFLD
jgi:7-keto-8-aminopelargonate synthetase-like enzyme